MRWFTIGFALILLFFMLGCEEEKVLQPTPEFAIQEVSLPANFSTLSHQPVRISARVSHPAGEAGIAAVTAILPDSSGSGSLTITLLDDGEAGMSGSGDLIAHDLIFTAQITPAEIWNENLNGNYQITVMAQATDGRKAESEPQTVRIAPNQPPQIVSHSFPDSIPAGLTPQEVVFTLQDNGGPADIRVLKLEGWKSGQTQPAFTDSLLNPQNNTFIYRMLIDSSYAAGKKGRYTMKFYAVDQFGAHSDTVETMSGFANLPPEISNAAVPDTVTIPQTGSLQILITVKVKDAQSLADIQQVWFDSYLPNGNPSSGNPFLLYDNGLPYDPNNPVAVGDQVAGDGVYSLTIFLPAGIPPGSYAFHFFAEDRAGQVTTGPVETIEAIQ